MPQAELTVPELRARIVAKRESAARKKRAAADRLFQEPVVQTIYQDKLAQWRQEGELANLTPGEIAAYVTVLTWIDIEEIFFYSRQFNRAHLADLMAWAYNNVAGFSPEYKSACAKISAYVAGHDVDDRPR